MASKPLSPNAPPAPPGFIPIDTLNEQDNSLAGSLVNSVVGTPPDRATDPVSQAIRTVPRPAATPMEETSEARFGQGVLQTLPTVKGLAMSTPAGQEYQLIKHAAQGLKKVRDYEQVTGHYPRYVPGEAAPQSVGAAAKEAGIMTGDTAGQMLINFSPSNVYQDVKNQNYAGAIGQVGSGLAQALLFHKIHAYEAGHVDPQALAETIATTHAESGGSTFNPRTGENMVGKNLWSVGIAPERTQVQDHPFTPAEINTFHAANSDVFDQSPNFHIGTWADPETGLHYIDIVGLTRSKNAALSLGNQLGEKGVFHLGRMEYAPTGFPEGPRPVPVYSILERLNLLHQLTPKTSPYAGIHYSNTNTPVLEGARRGTIVDQGHPAGAEAARLRLGSYLGYGENAPGGVYVYDQGTLGEPFITSRKYSHVVKGNYALADISNNKEWEQAKQAAFADAKAHGASDTQANMLALNAAENALKDAGYDGYFNGANKHMKNVKFLFGDQTVEAPPKNTSGVFGSNADIVNGLRKAFPNHPAFNPEIESHLKPEDNAQITHTRVPESSAAVASRSGTAAGAARETSIFKQVQSEHPDWSLSQQLMEAAKRSENGSGESVASLEAINRQASDRAQGIKYFRRDTRSGREIPLIGPDAPDTQAGPYDEIIRRGPDHETVLDRGIKARESRHEGDPANVFSLKYDNKK